MTLDAFDAFDADADDFLGAKNDQYGAMDCYGFDIHFDMFLGAG